jgi:Putative lumazine-binding
MKLAAIVCYLFITLPASAQPRATNLRQMENYTADSTAIAKVLTDSYFKGIYTGDVELLKTVYFDGTLLFGDVKGQPYYKTLAQYLDGVKNRQSPKDSGKPFDAQIQGIGITNTIAVARVQVKMYDFVYAEFLSFHKFDGKWLIVNKMISDIAQ